MRFILIILLLIFTIPFSMFCQTIEAEKSYLNQQVKSKKLNAEKTRKLKKNWDDLLKEFGSYPNLPYNDLTKRIEFVEVQKFDGIGKSAIYKMVMEWIAINYGAFGSAMHYEDKETGKIIVKGLFEISVNAKYKNIWGIDKSLARSMDCYHTAIFSVKENKLKIEFVNVKYEYQTGGYYSNVIDSYIPLEIRKFPMSDLYPITKAETDTWEYRLNVLQNTSSEVVITLNSIKAYIKDGIKRDSF